RSCCVVELAARRPEDLLTAIADAVGLRDLSTGPTVASLKLHLRERRLLLVLDNLEHLVARARPLVADLLAAAPDLTILATSRAPGSRATRGTRACTTRSGGATPSSATSSGWRSAGSPSSAAASPSRRSRRSAVRCPSPPRTSSRPWSRRACSGATWSGPRAGS